MLTALAILALADKTFARDLGGNKVQVFPSEAKRGVVTFFVIAGCPNADAYAPEMNRIAKEYGPKGWKFYLMYMDSMYNSKNLAEHSKQFGISFPSLTRDSALRERAKANKSPEAAVFSPSGDLLYHGRIDDRFYALGKRRSVVRAHDLVDALTAIEKGKPVPHASTEVIGCWFPND